MDVSLYQASAAMSATAHWQDVIAGNLASASIPGGRRQEVSFSDVIAGLATSSGAVKSNYYITSTSDVTNFKPGEMKATGGPTDFALEGPGFFTVQLPNGQHAYTRDGEFRLSSQGQLVTKQGYPVLGSNGTLQFNPNSSSAAITLSATGDLSQGADSIGKLQLTEFKGSQNLTSIGSGLFRADDESIKPFPAVSTQVRQGFVEASNTSPTTEMATLITAMRMFESNQKVLQMQSDRMSKTITELGGTS